MITPFESDEYEVAWVSSNPAVASVVDGSVKAGSNGTATITCYVIGNESVKASCVVDVNTIEVTNITLNPTSLTFNVIGGTYNLTASVKPSDADHPSVAWESSDSSIATVSDGKVTAVKNGNVTVKCYSLENPDIYATCNVTVNAADSRPADPDSPYTFKMFSVLDYGSLFEGGRQIDFNIFTNAPFEKVAITTSNNNIQYNTVFINDGNYDFSYYARKKGDCTVSVYLDGVLKYCKTVTITSDDANWARYEEWLLNEVKPDMGSNWNADDPLNTVINVGQYILDHYDYNPDANKSFHNDGCGNCNASAFVLKDVAQRLGLKAEVVNPSYWSSNTSHVVARIDMGDKYYDIDASAPGLDGKAGNRGDVVVMVLDK